MVGKYFGGVLPPSRRPTRWTTSSSPWPPALRDKYEAHMEKYAFQSALSEIFAVIARANKYIDENAPGPWPGYGRQRSTSCHRDV